MRRTAPGAVITNNYLDRRRNTDSVRSLSPRDTDSLRRDNSQRDVCSNTLYPPIIALRRNTDNVRLTDGILTAYVLVIVIDVWAHTLYPPIIAQIDLSTQ